MVAAAPRLSSQGIAFDVVGRNAIRHDPHFAGGQYYDGTAPEAGLALARMLAHITYLSDESMRAKFDPTRLAAARRSRPASRARSPSARYLAHQGERFVERFDANSYITLSTAMDLFDLGDATGGARASRSRPPPAAGSSSASRATGSIRPSASRQLVDALVAQLEAR